MYKAQNKYRVTKGVEFYACNWAYTSNGYHLVKVNVSIPWFIFFGDPLGLVPLASRNKCVNCFFRLVYLHPQMARLDAAKLETTSLFLIYLSNLNTKCN